MWRCISQENLDDIHFLPPEGKGRLLHALCQSQWPIPLLGERQEDAILAILKTIQTRNEYREVMEHLTPDGRRLRPKPATGIDDGTWRKGEDIIRKFLDGAQLREFRRLRRFIDRAALLPEQPRMHTAALRNNGILTA